MYPIVITSDNNSWRVTDDGTSYTATIPAGTYYAYESVAEITGYPRLYTALYDQMGLNQDIQPFAGTPSLSNLQVNGGLQFIGSSSAAFSFDFNHVDWTFPPQYIGFAADQATSVSSSASGVLTAPYTPYGIWDSFDPARSKIGFTSRKMARATEDVERSDAYEVSWGSRLLREVVYRYVPAAHVHGARALQADHASTGELALGDIYQGFDLLWNSLAKLDTILILHGGQGSLDAENAEWEAVRLFDSSQAESFGNVARLMSMGGEFYELVLTLVRLEGSYTQ